MRTAYLFDVDGTLTPSRKPMDREFRLWFCEFMCNNNVYLVTGSDYAKTIEQLGRTITENVNAVYNCSGNDVWVSGQNIYSSDWELPELARYFLDSCLYESKFDLRTGLHFEHRPGMVNFSIVGRNATLAERKLYSEYDTETDERNTIAAAFNVMFGDEIVATAGGETGLDIYPVGKDKAQILDDFSEYDRIVFFGDRCDPLGNDHTLAQALSALSEHTDKHGEYYNVADWQETWKILQEKTQPIEI